MGYGKEVQNWVDPAMFAAEEQDAQGPRVQLLSCTSDPLGTIASVADAYKGKFHESLAEIADSERRFYLDDVRKNVLLAPLEFVHFHFRITGVTRGFTHQMVRQRTAAYAQESMRFAVKETMPVALPPSLAGTMSWSVWIKECRKQLFPAGIEFNNKKHAHDTMIMVDKYAEEQASPQQIHRRIWDETVADISKAYNTLVNSGMPAEDARGLAPTSVLTQLNYTTSLRHLIDHAGLRLCTQAQFEWRLVWVEIIKAIREYGKTQMYLRPIPDELSELRTGHLDEQQMNAAWQFDTIADLFKPICYKTGKCEFMSEGDRFCTIRERVNAFHDLGIPSTRWNEPIEDVDKNLIGPILDEEWLADPKAARA